MGFWIWINLFSHFFSHGILYLSNTNILLIILFILLYHLSIVYIIFWDVIVDDVSYLIIYLLLTVNITSYYCILYFVYGICCFMLYCLMQIYARLANKLTEWECPRTESEFEARLTFKLYILQFVNYYSSLFYIAFFKGR